MTTDNQPITGLCIVEQTCPAGYIMIDSCDDTRSEADLWKDQLFGKKVKRYLCITRVFPLGGGTLNNVLVDLTIVDDKEQPPVGYSALSLTQDTSDAAMRKKTLCAKLVARTQATDAITDIVFYGKLKKAQPGYTLVGELNGLTLCFKVGKVSNQSAPPPIPPSQPSINPEFYSNRNTVYTGLRPPAMQMSYNPYAQTPVNSALQGHPAPVQTSVAPAPTLVAPAPTAVAPVRQDSHTRSHPLTGVPFEIHPRLVSTGSDKTNLSGFSIKSRANIMNEFEYSFVVERQAQQTSLNFNGI
ncbi:multivesicular body subunit 12B-like isoform X2 [Watersipora subatra]|uniref:multivesicular body subunit 12B-like isoform X2 n=1 Tax=Watersipora subatra TaxID=2589382 RepID=UPI00355C80FF